MWEASPFWQGYWGLPDPTSGSLIPDPRPGKTSGGKVYRTGDLSRYDDEGNPIFLERRSQ